MLQSPTSLFRLEETPNSKWRPYATGVTAVLLYLGYDAGRGAAGQRGTGELNTAEGVERAARRMLDDPKARDGVDEFVSQWLRFDRVMTASRERRLFPLFSRELAALDDRGSAAVCRTTWCGAIAISWTLFTANYSFINSDLAAVYKMPPPARDFDRVEFPAESRAGRAAGTGAFPDPVE